jgi:hypothetical protein
MPTTGSVHVVQFKGVDWGNEESKSERGHLQRKAQIVRRRKNKAFKKMAAAETERLRRFLRFVKSMNFNDELRPLLPEAEVRNFFNVDRDDHQQNVIRLQGDLLASDAIILGNVLKRAALTLLQDAFIRGGNFSEEDDFLQTLFAIQDLDQILESNKALFVAFLDAFYNGRGEYDEHKQRFLERQLRVAQIDGDGATMVRELRGALIAEGVIDGGVVDDGSDNSEGVPSSGSSDEG